MAPVIKGESSMRPAIDRRAFLSATAAGLILPVRPAFARLWPASGFTHGVASGHPGPGEVTLWTRYASVTGAATTGATGETTGEKATVGAGA